MKIAVTYENGEIFQHFGHSEYIKIYEAEDGKIISSGVISTMGSGHGALVDILSIQNVDILICGGIGGGAKAAMNEAGIKLYGGVAGDADLAVNNLLANRLSYNPEVECNHHNKEEHRCGEHSCNDQ